MEKVRIESIGEGRHSDSYYPEVNVVRGLALILVVLGHSFPDGDMGPVLFSAKWIRSYLYLFHMGVFFVLSGFVMSARLYQGTYSLKTQIWKKVSRLLFPYFFYSILTLLPKLILSRYANNPVDLNSLWMVLLGKSPNGGMWFLWHLFLISVVFLCAMRILSNAGIGIKTAVLMAIGILGYCIYELDPAGILSNSCKYALFFSVGVVLGRYYDSAKKCFRLIPALILLAVDWIIACPRLNISIAYGLTGIIGFYGIFAIGVHVNEKKTGIKRALDYLGKNSYGIYLLSYFGQIPLRIVLYSRMHMPYWVCVGAMFIGGMFLPMIGIWIIRKNKPLRLVALGEK